MRRYLWAPALKCFGVQRIHRLRDVMILAGAGVGGGSLNYANTLYVPPPAFFEDPQWAHITDWQAELAPHYETASRMLGVVTNPCDGPVEQVMRAAAKELGVEATFRHTPVGVFLGEPGVRVADPYFGGAGPERTGCTMCGNCMVGCRDGAKNTLVKNYLWLAERRGATIEPMRTVVDIRPLDPSRPEAGYAVTTRASGAWVRRDRQTVTAGQVVIAAGAWGTANLLQRLKATSLPRLSDALGDLTRTNSEALGGAQLVQVPGGVDLTRGLAITTSFHVDEVTHVENCRYGTGSNLMGLLATLMVDAEGRVPRPLRFVAEAARHPGDFVRSLSVRRWSERTVVALVMQSLDNSLTVRGRRGRLGRVRLTSRQGHGEPNPTWFPQASTGVRALCAALTRHTGVRAMPGRERLGRRRHAAHRALHRRVRHLRLAIDRGGRSLPPGVGVPGAARRRRVHRLGQPRGQPGPDHHRPGRAGDVAVAGPRGAWTSARARARHTRRDDVPRRLLPGPQS